LNNFSPDSLPGAIQAFRDAAAVLAQPVNLVFLDVFLIPLEEITFGGKGLVFHPCHGMLPQPPQRCIVLVDGLNKVR